MSPVSSRTIMMSSPATIPLFSDEAAASFDTAAPAAGWRTGPAPCGAASRLAGARFARKDVVFRPADRAQYDRVGSSRDRERRVGQRRSRRVVARSADGRGFGFDRQAVAPQALEHLGRFGDDLVADAIARKHGDFHELRPQGSAEHRTPAVIFGRCPGVLGFDAL